MRGTRFTISLTLASVVAAWVLAAGAPGAGARPAPDPAYTIWRIAGSSAQCTTPPACRDGGAATLARLSFPEALALDSRGDLYLADLGDNEIRKVSPGGTISLVAGTGTLCQQAPQCGDGGPATAARLSTPDGVAVSPSGDVYIADTGDNEIREVTPQGRIRRVAGDGTACSHAPACGDGGPATRAQLKNPTGLALDHAGNLYISDTGDQEIRKLSPSGTITRVAGTGVACTKPSSCGDGGSATAARLSFPQGLALNAGELYVADGGDQEIRRISPQGVISVLAGTGSACSGPPDCGDGGPATSAQLNFPNGIAVDAAGNVYIADAGDNEVRAVSGGTIRRLAGTGSACSKPTSCGDNGKGGAAMLDYPDGIVADHAGHVFVSDSYDNTVRFLTAQHPARIYTSSGRVALAAFGQSVTGGRAAIRYVIGHPASMTLSVRMGGHWIVVGHGHAAGGLGQMRWNGRLHHQHVPKGRYQMMVTATIAHHSGSSTLRLKF